MSETDVQFPPKFQQCFKPARFKVVYGGRGGSKSWAVGRKLILDALQGAHRILCVREYQNSIQESVHRLLSDQIETMGVGSFFTIQRDTIECNSTGAVFFFSGLRNNAARIKSYERITRVWAEEAENISDDSWDLLLPTVRTDGAEIYIVFNPRMPSDATYRRFVVDPPKDAIVVQMNLWDNPWAPQSLLDEAEECKVKNPLKWRWVWNGECVQSTGMSLFNWDYIENNRLLPTAEIGFGSVVVSIDPALTSNAHSDETGIVVAANSKGAPRHFYLLNDSSGTYTPAQWAGKALNLYEQYAANYLLIEVNAGADLLTHTLKGVCQSRGIPVPMIKEIRAMKGKVPRMEPVSALYESGLVHHVGRFPTLEDQLLRFSLAEVKRDSPDRAEALGQALTELSAGRAPMKIAQNALSMLLGTNLAARR